ncbi:MAG: hypothetical protein RJA99_3791 [Pseudomonadota bacterium]|jgi:signal transduction histidine kinase
MPAPLHPDEPTRVAALHRYRVLDTPPEREFDEMARLASTLCETPLAAVSFVAERRQWFKAELGLGVRETGRDASVCAYAILGDEEVFEIPDLAGDPRTADNPHVTGAPWLRFYASAPLRAPDGRPIGALCVMDRRPRSLSRVQRLALRTLGNQLMDQLELRRVLAEQRDSEARKDEFLAMLAHELRNPLAPLANALHVLRRSASLGADARDVLAMADRQLHQLRRLIDDLLEAGRITRGRIALRREPMPVAAAVRAAVESTAGLRDARRQRLGLALPDATLRIVADPVRVAQIIGNLLDNASRYTPEDGSIRVEAHDAGDAVEIRVVDDGIGIEPSQLPFLFEVFSQIDATIDRARGGLGIGLAMVRRLVELHGGTVRAESAGRGRGSSFSVRLPRDGRPPGAVASVQS